MGRLRTGAILLLVALPLAGCTTVRKVEGRDDAKMIQRLEAAGFRAVPADTPEKKARLETWRQKEPIKVSGGRCTTTAKSVGDANISEGGRKLLADQLQRLLAAERQNKTITRTFAASRNSERDQPASEWAAEFERKSRMIIDARCGN